MDYQSRQRIRQINQLQASLKRIRSVIGWTGQEFGELLGMTRQTVNSLEIQKNKLTATQYLAICATLENVFSHSPQLRPPVMALLNPRTSSDISADSLLSRWFDTFPEAFSSDKLSVEILSEPDDLSLLVRDYKIFVNHDILMHPKAVKLFFGIQQRLNGSNNVLIVPARVIEALHKLRSGNESEKRLVVKAMSIIKVLKKNNFLEIRGQEDDPEDLTEMFYLIFNRFHCQHKLCLLTQDREMAERVLSLNQQDCYLKYQIEYGYIDDSGEFMLSGSPDSAADAESFGMFSTEKKEIEQDSDQISKTAMEGAAQALRGWDEISSVG